MITLLTGTILAAAAAPQTGFVEVPSSLMQEIGAVLPERSNAGASFVSTSYSPNVLVSQQATLEVVFLWEGAGYRNSLGYFTYREEADGSVTILDSDLIIANASFPNAGNAQTGDHYDLLGSDGLPRVFEPGDRVGFFVVADGWGSEPRIRDWSETTTGIPATTPAENQQIGRGCYTTIDRLNPESATGVVDAARHCAMLWFPAIPGFLDSEPFLVTGFEDLNRTGNSDDDFNDLVFIVTGTPIEAIEDTPVLDYQPGDPDGDGVLGTEDHFPLDPERAFVNAWPSNGVNVYAFEDQYPNLGDADFNDVLLGTSFEVVTNAEGEVKDILLTSHLIGRGAGYDHSVGLHVPGIPDSMGGTLETERIFSGDEPIRQPLETKSMAEVVGDGNRFLLYESTREALPPLPGATFTNTQFEGIDRPAASSRSLMTFDTAVSQDVIGLPPYDLYIEIHHGDERWDVHLPGNPGFADRPEHLPIEEGPRSFVDQGRPWMLEIPTTWRFPRENVRIWNAYPQYNAWANSAGARNRSWYLNPDITPGLIGLDLNQYVPSREWTVLIPR